MPPIVGSAERAKHERSLGWSIGLDRWGCGDGVQTGRCCAACDRHDEQSGDAGIGEERGQELDEVHHSPMNGSAVSRNDSILMRAMLAAISNTWGEQDLRRFDLTAGALL